ncbi:hypothetical protein DPMN_178460 [Dreissena polymorpha]|uniref:Uncharacterized protein n=1 Tax=Dreissena polymorpha TaxID=45954 RepID=A0A9D4EAM4_DREPO|nr:hypothetical protein DPMN_178460 [Dreissena polymorpha]
MSQTRPCESSEIQRSREKKDMNLMENTQPTTVLWPSSGHQKDERKEAKPKILLHLELEIGAAGCNTWDSARVSKPTRVEQ